MDACSSFVDPISTHSDRQKPDVAAPGHGIQSTTPGFPWIGGIGSGTSFASPMAAGVADLLIQRNPGLSIWPERIKAIMMATAVHNIEGASRLSDRDGAGGISASLADRVARHSGGDEGGLSYSCSTGGPRTTLRAVSLTGGQKVRAAIAWDTSTAFGDYANRPAQDLDLWVTGPSGALTATSLSWDSTAEVVEFTAPTSGSYTLAVNPFRCDVGSTFLGWSFVLL